MESKSMTDHDKLILGTVIKDLEDSIETLQELPNMERRMKQIELLRNIAGLTERRAR